jgi:hypothetical protein
MRALLILFCLFLCAGCSMFLEAEEAVGTGLQSKPHHQLSADALNEYGAPFLLDTAYIQENKLWIEVAFSGGCQEHDFMLAWPDMITMVHPPDFGLTLYHKNSTDQCKALIRDVFKVELGNTPLGEFSTSSIASMRINVVNGSQPEISKSTR